MKTLILYATKYGATQEIANRIAGKIDGAAAHDLKGGGIPPLAGYDCVIIGSSLYIGAIRKEAKAFTTQNADALRGKKLGLFLSGLETGKEKEFFEANFPADLLGLAAATSILGGIFDPKKAGAMERMVMKTVAKYSAYTNTIDDAKIQAFLRRLGL